MRKVKKLLGLLLAAVMVLAMGVPTFAASGEYTITINNALAGHTYQAYQVFAGDLSENEETLSNVTWGDGVDGTAILTALKGIAGLAAVVPVSALRGRNIEPLKKEIKKS